MAELKNCPICGTPARMMVYDGCYSVKPIVPRWISVEERLPEGEGWVLVIGLLLKKKKGNYGWCVPHVAEYRHGRWCDADGMLPDLEERSLKVTHWMHLPEPPEEERND